jgi:ATP-dependent Clp protease ATP-binding subunit ClpC
MSFVNFNIPVLVQNKKINKQSSFVLRPLFLNYPVVNARRFEQAVTHFKKEIRRNLNNYLVNQESLDGLLSYLFNPTLEYLKLELSIPLGKTSITGTFSVAVFDLQNKTFACLPAFQNYFFMVDKTKKKKNSFEANTIKVIEVLFKNLQDQLGADFSPNDYFSDSREFIANIQTSLNIRSGKFAFEESDPPGHFQNLNQSTDFDGSIEIEKIGENLNNRYPEELKRSYFRDDLINRLSSIIYQNENTPIVLIGKEGVGKQTAIHEVVYQYLKSIEEEKKQKEELFSKVWQIDPTRVISGMSIVGWWEKRLESIIKFVITKQKGEHDKLLFSNIVALIRIGKSGSNNLAMSDVLRPYLEKRQLQVILTATPAEWKILQEKDRRFSDLFQVIRIEEPDLKTAAKMVLQQRIHLEIEQGCTFTIQAINQVFHFQRNYQKRKALPGSVMKMMNQLAAKYRFQYIDALEVKSEFESISGLNEKIFDSSYIFENEEVRSSIASRLVGQDAAVDTLTDTIHLLKAKLNNPEKPISSFLFIGPTGVGKTQAAKELCNYMMGSEDSLIRFDMNEYIDEGAPSRLIGDYYNPEGQLTGKVRYRPFGVILLDEIEKAHPKVHDLLLQVLDDGRLTDSLGRTIDFSNTIIIMTSNIGASDVSLKLGFDKENRDDSSIYKKAVENFFRPEFINRIDRIVIFNPLGRQHIHNIAKLQIDELLRRDGFVRRTTILNITKEALEWVAHRGYDPKMGGRALKRQIEKDLTALSADQLISTKSENPIILEISLENDSLIPVIHPLEFVEELPEGWLPTLPNESHGKGFYNQLIRRVEAIERKVKNLEQNSDYNKNEVIVIGNEKGENLDWQYYDFKERITSIKQTLKTLSLGFKDKYFHEAPAIPLRLKSNSLIPRNDAGWSKLMRSNAKDRVFQMDALKEVKESYQYSAAQFDSLQTEFIENFLDVSFLEISSYAFLKKVTDKIILDFKSYIQGRGDMEIKYLKKIYSDLLQELNLSFEYDKKDKYFIIEGHGVYELLKNEEGIHLFYIPYSTPIPIGVSLRKTNSKPDRTMKHKVIRLYDQHATLTDLRSGFTNAITITPGEFKLLLYAGIHSQEQI